MGAGSSMPPTAGSGASNSADVAFATGMIPHHEQAVEMAQMVLDKQGIDPRVTALANKIKAAQSPEITTMKGWLTAWGAPVPSGMSNMAGMSGLMSPADMDALKSATGLTASKLFLTQMTQHHNGAIDMAKVEVTSGKNPDAIALAKKIVTDQQAEITEMSALLASL